MTKEFTQIYGIDYSKTYTPTLGTDILRLLLTIMAIKDMEAHQIDINNAFTKSVLHNIIYIHPPKRLKVPNRHVFLVVKSLYDLK